MLRINTFKLFSLAWQEVQLSGEFIVTTEGFQDVKSVSNLAVDFIIWLEYYWQVNIIIYWRKKFFGNLKSWQILVHILIDIFFL